MENGQRFEREGEIFAAFRENLEKGRCIFFDSCGNEIEGDRTVCDECCKRFGATCR